MTETLTPEAPARRRRQPRTSRPARSTRPFPEITCAVCGEGHLEPARPFRLSRPIALIGAIALAASTLLGLVVLWAMGSAAFQAARAAEEPTLSAGTVQALRDAGLDQDSIDALAAGRTVTAESKDQMGLAALMAIRQAEIEARTAKTSQGIVTAATGAVSFAGLGTAIAGLLLGLILTLRKEILQCGRCGAAVPAS